MEENDKFCEYYFGYKESVKQAVHSLSGETASAVVKIKLDTLRQDRWANSLFIIHGNLNDEL